MRRLLCLAAFVVFAALVSTLAQRSGMRASGGGHDVSARHASAGNSFNGIRSGPGMGSVHPFGSFRGHRIGGSRIHRRVFRNCFGCRSGYGYPWYAGYGGYYDPYWWSDSSSYDEDQARDQALADERNAASLEEQRLREDEDRERERDRDFNMRRSQAREERNPPGLAAPATALVFRDKHVEEVRNYAIAGGTLWVLNEQAAKRIPLAQLDLAATVKMNDERGVDFQVPR